MEKEKIFGDIKEKFYDIDLGTESSIVVNGDSLELLNKVPDHSIALILTDPPYHSTKKRNIVGDTSFSKDSDYIEWMKKYAIEWKRVLKHNGSIFCFCSSAMSAQLQIMFSQYFNILSEITWTKPNAPGYDGWKQKMKKESLRQWYPHSERIIFMENAVDGNLFKSYFGSQLTVWRKSVKMSTIKLAEITGAYGKVNHGGAVANWEAGRNIPSREQYEKIKAALTEAGVEDIPDFEDIIRPFNVNKDVEFTDVWTFENVRQYRRFQAVLCRYLHYGTPDDRRPAKEKQCDALQPCDPHHQREICRSGSVPCLGQHRDFRQPELLKCTFEKGYR